MSDTNIIINQNVQLYEQRIKLLQEIIKRTIINTNKNRTNNLIGQNELNICLKSLEKSYNVLIELNKNLNSTDEKDIMDKLQFVTNELSIVFKNYGTNSVTDLLMICFGSDYIKNMKQSDKLKLIKEYVHPINYKLINWKSNTRKTEVTIIRKTRIVEDFTIVETSDNLDCFDLARTSKVFYTRVYGIKIAFHNEKQKKTMIVCGIIDDMMLECINNKFVFNKLKDLIKNKPKEIEGDEDSFNTFLRFLTLKDLLIYNEEEIYNRFIGYQNQLNLIKQKNISQIIKEFLNNTLYGQRTMLIQLLMKPDVLEFQYIAYLLYDLLNSNNKKSLNSDEQTQLFNSFPWNIKKQFKDAMKQTIAYTTNLNNLNNVKIPLEQQICLMKASEKVKEKAMIKLKEVKAKSEESGSKARQYLEALLKIPFGVLKEEPIMNIAQNNINIYSDLTREIRSQEDLSISIRPGLINKKEYTNVEVIKNSEILKKSLIDDMKTENVNKLKSYISKQKRNDLIRIIILINGLIKENNLSSKKINHSNKNMSFMRSSIYRFIDENYENTEIFNKLVREYSVKTLNVEKINTNLNKIEKNHSEINNYIKEVNDTLDKAIHGHNKAKKQIERIIGQWINGEKTGYCFGFEGAPGVGKTTLAKKGIANCLKDNDGVSRPFSFIAIGGSSNGSTLEGHNYTYVGSTWGRIVDILMETKCMNPIIFIDELDKVSKTEHGREIVGILTHLTDTTQNDSFQDKYFNGIDIDLSKVLFIFSYNDVSQIDRILLDRIHRIKFENLTLEDKLEITKSYLLPEIYKKMGLKDVIEINEDVIKFVINNYTRESGVRKLKELLFEIVGEINLKMLKTSDFEVPVKVTVEEVENVFLKERRKIKHALINKKSSVGLINGLWANVLGQGGVLPIEISLYPSNNFLELKLTGMQGDVMKESMTVAKSLAWKLASEKYPEKVKKILEDAKDMKLQGLHIHVPSGSTPKDGPSAGSAITTALYSLFTNQEINNKIAMTGEITLQGNVTEIGGLDLKILGGIKAGVEVFLYPKENKYDFDKFMEKYGEDEITNNITFHEVDNIHDVFEIVFSE